MQSFLPYPSGKKFTCLSEAEVILEGKILKNLLLREKDTHGDQNDFACQNSHFKVPIFFYYWFLKYLSLSQIIICDNEVKTLSNKRVS